MPSRSLSRNSIRLKCEPTATIRLAPRSNATSIATSSLVPGRGQQLVLEPQPLEALAPRRRAVLIGVHDQLRAAASAPGPRRSPCRRSRGRASAPPRAARRRRRPRRPAPGAGRGCTGAARAGRACSRCRARRSARGGRGTPCAGPGSPGARRGCSPSSRMCSSVFSAKSSIASPMRCCCSRGDAAQLGDAQHPPLGQRRRRARSRCCRGPSPGRRRESCSNSGASDRVDERDAGARQDQRPRVRDSGCWSTSRRSRPPSPRSRRGPRPPCGRGRRGR